MSLEMGAPAAPTNCIRRTANDLRPIEPTSPTQNSRFPEPEGHLSTELAWHTTGCDRQTITAMVDLQAAALAAVYSSSAPFLESAAGWAGRKGQRKQEPASVRRSMAVRRSTWAAMALA